MKEALDEKAGRFFFMGFREKFLQENDAATDDEIERAFQHVKRTDELFMVKLRVVKFIVAVGIAIKYIAPGAALAGLAIYFGVDRLLGLV